MRNLFLATALMMATPLVPAAEPRPAQIPADLCLTESWGPHRLLAFQACSSEHCWHEFFIQELSLSPNRKIICSVAVPELNKSSDMVAHAARWQPGSTPVLELELKSAHDVFVPYIATLSFTKGCKYELRPDSPPAAGNSIEIEKPALRGALRP